MISLVRRMLVVLMFEYFKSSNITDINEPFSRIGLQMEYQILDCFCYPTFYQRPVLLYNPQDKIPAKFRSGKLYSNK